MVKANLSLHTPHTHMHVCVYKILLLEQFYVYNKIEKKEVRIY